MDNSPVSKQFLSIINHTIINGTIPRDSETRPHVQVSYNDTALRGDSTENNKPIGIIGPSDDGIPNHVYKIDSVQQASRIFGGGPLLEGIRLAWQPGSTSYGNGGSIYAERVQNAKQATLNAGALHFKSTIYGKNANDVQLKLSKDPLTNTWTLQVMDRKDSYHRKYTGLGLLGHIQYMPNAWTKYNMPAGQKDYAWATMQIKPKVINTTKGGKLHSKIYPFANQLVFTIHDTKKPAIIYNNLTNNLNDDGSTVYEDNARDASVAAKDIKPSTYQPDNPNELQVTTPASKGDLNPNRGPFETFHITINLNDSNIQNITQLFAKIQQLGSSDGRQYFNLNIMDGHSLNHIQPQMLDLSPRSQPIDIIPALDGSTTDKDGNNVEPAGIWSTLGDICDHLRFDSHVHVTGDMSEQLNIIPTAPSAVNRFNKIASYNDSIASSDASEASYNAQQAADANNNNLPDMANEYQSVANSESTEASLYTSMANDQTSLGLQATQSVNSEITQADESANAVASYGAQVESSDANALNQYESLTPTTQGGEDVVKRSSTYYKETGKLISLANSEDSALSVASSIQSKYTKMYSEKAVHYSSVASKEASKAYHYLPNTLKDEGYPNPYNVLSNEVTSYSNKASEEKSEANSYAAHGNNTSYHTMSLAASTDSNNYHQASAASANAKPHNNNYAHDSSIANSDSARANAFALNSYTAGFHFNSPTESAESSAYSLADHIKHLRHMAVSQANTYKSDMAKAASEVNSAQNAALNYDKSTFNETTQGLYPNNIQKLMTYTANLIHNIHEAMGDVENNNNIQQPNIVESDLDALSNIAQKLGTPQTTLSVAMYKAGVKMKKDLANALKAIKGIKQNDTNSRAYFDNALNQFNKDLLGDQDVSQPCPRGIFTSNVGDGQINILGEPISAFDWTSLSGGETSDIPIDWSLKLKNFDDTPVYDMVALSPHENIHVDLAAYIGDRYNASQNMRGFVGGGFDEDAQQLIQRSTDLDNNRICLIGTSGDFTIGGGEHEDIPAYMTAAVVAGMDSSLPVGTSILNKNIAFNKVDQDFTSTELDALDQNGIIVALPEMNRGVTKQFKVSDDVTTDNDDSDPVKSQLTLGEVTDFLFDDMRLYLRQYIGDPVTVRSSAALVDAVNNFLWMQSSADGNGGLIEDFNPDDTFCEIHNESAYIEFSVVPTLELRWIHVIGSYLGSDQTAGMGGQSFAITNADGQFTTNNTDSTNGLIGGSDDNGSDSQDGDIGSTDDTQANED